MISVQEQIYFHMFLIKELADDESADDITNEDVDAPAMNDAKAWGL